MVDLKEKLKTLPEQSGVYIMRDEDNNIIYIGKARSLKKRVSQYFSSYGTSSEKVMAMMTRVRDFNYIITPGEVDALILENNLIKKHKPYYNILLKDDKSYPFLRIDVKDDFPCIEVVRRVTDDGARYFGPYMQGISAKDITELIFGTFPIRSCSINLKKLPESHRPCLNYHIGRCLGPCSGKLSIEAYAEAVDRVIAFLQGNDKKVAEILKDRMLASAEKEEFELAQYYKDRLASLDKLVRKQVTYLAKDYNLDVFGVADNGVDSAVNVLFVRGGKLVGSENVIINTPHLNENAALNEYLARYYGENPILADEVVASVKIEDEKALQELWSDKFGRKINLVTPVKGIRRQLADMAESNAEDYLRHYAAEQERKHRMTLGSIEQLRESLGLKEPLKRIECYDISNISGTDKVASMVVFADGQKEPSLYRRFKIKTVKGSDDFASLRETIDRRFKRLIEGEDESFSAVPGLILIDGGKGQLSSSLEAMRANGYNIPMAGLAKREEILVREEMEDLILPRNSLALHLIQRIRDEAHRFAITYHRKLRVDRQTRSELLKIEDVGEERVKNLYRKFKGIDGIRNASVKELAETDGIGETTAKKIYGYFRQEDTKEEN